MGGGGEEGSVQMVWKAEAMHRWRSIRCSEELELAR